MHNFGMKICGRANCAIKILHRVFKSSICDDAFNWHSYVQYENWVVIAQLVDWEGKLGE